MTELYRLKYINKYLEIYYCFVRFVVILILKHDQYEKNHFFNLCTFFCVGWVQSRGKICGTK